MSLRSWQWKLSLSGIFGMNRRNVELVYDRNPRRLYRLADDKLLAKELLDEAGVPVPANLASASGLHELPALLETLDGLDDFVVKPSLGGGGNGILVVGPRLESGLWLKAGGREISEDQLHTHLANILFGAYARGALKDRVMVEPRVFPHSVYGELWSDGLCDVRIITLDGQPAMAMVRVPTARSDGKANLHQGGIGLSVDLRTGRVDRAVCDKRALTHHPDSGVPLVGLQLPLWAETVRTARMAAAAVPLGFLGVDVVVDMDRGPLVLEINARPGLEIQNVNERGLGLALEEVA
jgi:alpha-L-glutamate ligase-like protein